MYQDLINNIIPADDLHWDSTENKYVSLSEQEVQEVIGRCLEQGITDLDQVYKVIQWCGIIRVGQLLWKNFLLGSLEISGFDKMNEPIFKTSRRKDEN